MDGHRRGEYSAGNSGFSDSAKLNPDERMRSQPHHPQNSSNVQHDVTDHSTSSLAPSFPRNVPGIVYDRLMYSSLQRPFLPIAPVHPALQSRNIYPMAISGLNGLNPDLLMSSNDNNNCNSRSRAASHSTVLEMQQQHQAMRLPFHLPPASQYPICLHKLPPNFLSNLIAYRRNSTNTSLPPESFPSTAPQNSINIPPPFDRPPPPYPTSNAAIYSHADILQQHPVSSLRRDRYSIGGLLTGTNTVLLRNEFRRNSIPAALEVQQPSEESTENSSSVEDDDDDVFDVAAPSTAPHSATDQASYLQQLRESRKRALTAPEGPSQSKYSCNSDIRRARFRRCDNDFEQTEEKGSQNHRGVQEFAPIDVPRTSQVPRIIVNGARSDRNQNKDTAVEMETNTAEKTRSSQTAITSKPLQTRTATPSPSILKAPKIQRNSQINSHSTQPSISGVKVDTKIHNQSNIVSKTQAKKHVAWKDRPKAEEVSTDVIMTPINHELLSDQNLKQVKKNPDGFTEKEKMGPFYFGPEFGTSPVKSISHFLVRKEGTFKYYLAKVLCMGNRNNDDKSGKLLLYSEHSLLTLLRNHPGVVREHGLYKDVAYNKETGNIKERVCLILDCLAPHQFDPSTKDYIILQKHVMKVGRLQERETIRIFTLILNIVHSLHELNVVHRDLKLENMVLLEKCQKVVLTNFCLGRHLMSDDDLLKDRRGSPAYISPDVLSGKPYAGKPSDMWSLGVVLFMMLYGQFPFYDKDPAKLFKKIQKADFAIPSNVRTSTQINEIIRGLLTLDPAHRLTSGDTLLALQQCASSRSLQRFSSSEVQVVPDIDDEKETSSESDDDKNEDAEEKLTREFQLKLLSDDEDITSIENRHKAFSRSTHQATLPTIQHCPYDMRPLTQEEMALHRRLLVNSSLGVRVQGSS